tara:strand:- start:1230 stop:1445 length:216 start_codon:yes stop_codon:yes gene_type:complete
MGIFKQPKAPMIDSELDKQMKERREEEEKAKKAKAEKEKELKWRKSKGMVGTRSLFSRAGGKGFYYEGKEI